MSAASKSLAKSLAFSPPLVAPVQQLERQQLPLAVHDMAHSSHHQQGHAISLTVIFQDWLAAQGDGTEITPDTMQDPEKFTVLSWNDGR